jgi:hypothetical protein
MPHCHGAGEFGGIAFQGDCGSAEPHGGHDFTEEERVCPGSPFSFMEADCGHAGPHEEHPLNTEPTMLDEEPSA